MLTSVWRFLRKLKRELPYDPAIPLLGIHPDKTIIQKDIHTLMFIIALLTIIKTWKQPKFMLIDRRMDKEDVYIYTKEYYLAIKKE